MRDKIVHHYFGLDYEAVFLTLHYDLPPLKQGIQLILRNPKGLTVTIIPGNQRSPCRPLKIKF